MTLRQIQLTDNDRNIHIQNLRKVLDFSLQYKPLGDIMIAYATGGTVRRLYMLENNIPLYENDFNAMYESDIDLHCAIDYDTTRKPNRGLFNKIRSMISLDDFGIGEQFFDTWGLHDQPLVHGVDFDHNMTLQYINIQFTKMDYDELDKNVSSIVLPYDLDSSKFLYHNGVVYDRRINTRDDFFDDSITIDTEVNFRSIQRIMKFQKYGFRYRIDNLKQFLEGSIRNILVTGDNYGVHKVNIRPLP